MGGGGRVAEWRQVTRMGSKPALASDNYSAQGWLVRVPQQQAQRSTAQRSTAIAARTCTYSCTRDSSMSPPVKLRVVMQPSTICTPSS